METWEAVRLETPALRLERVYREIGDPLWRSLVAFTAGRRDIAEDAVSEAFARAMANLASIRDPAAWVFRTAHRLALRELRRERRHPVALAPREEPSGPGWHEELMAALRHLSPMQRSAVVLHYEADLPVREIAALLGISAATVKVHLFRGRQHLRKLLGAEEVDDE